MLIQITRKGLQRITLFLLAPLVFTANSVIPKQRRMTNGVSSFKTMKKIQDMINLCWLVLHLASVYTNNTNPMNKCQPRRCIYKKLRFKI